MSLTLAEGTEPAALGASAALGRVRSSVTLPPYMRQTFDDWLKHQSCGSSPSDALRFGIEAGRALLDGRFGPPTVRDLGQGVAAIRELRSIVDGTIGLAPGDAVLKVEDRLAARLLDAEPAVRSSMGPALIVQAQLDMRCRAMCCARSMASSTPFDFDV